MMRLENTFRVGLPVQDAWDLLTDLPRVAGCLPGAHLDEVLDGEYRGGLATKIGPVNARYQGTASFLEYDEVAHKAVITARGREEKGSGSASATITLTLDREGADSTDVQVLTDLAISGRAAQFGRSLLAEVSTAMIGEFAERLEAMTGADGSGVPIAGSQRGPHDTPSSASSASSAADTAGGRGPHAAADTRDAARDPGQLDLGRTLVLPLLRKAAVPLMLVCAGGLVGALVRRPRHASPAATAGFVSAPSGTRWDSTLPIVVCYAVTPER
jgi:uncharacterized protein